MSYTEEEQIEEAIHFANIVATFEHYEQHSVRKGVSKSFLTTPLTLFCSDLG